MDNNLPNHISHSGSTTLSVISFLASMVSFLLADLTKSDVAWAVGILSGSTAFLSGIMAIRYYYYATKKVK